MLKRPPVLLLVGLAAAGSLALNIFIPSIPGLVAFFQTDLATVQLVLSLYLVTVAAGQLVYGPLSDRFGRRPVLLAGIVVYVAGSFVCAFAPTIGTLIAARVAQALGASCGWVLCRAIVRDVFAAEKAASTLGYITTAMAAVPMVAPAIGGVLDEWFSWRASFLAVALLGAALLLLAILAGHETHHARSATTQWGDLVRAHWVLLRSRRFLAYSVNVSMSAAAFFAFLTGASVLTIDVLRTPVGTAGLWFGTVSVAYMGGNFLAGRYSQRVGLHGMMLAGSLLSFAGGLALLLAALVGHLSVGMLFASMGIAAFGNGISQPNGTAGAIGADPRYAGTASGLVGFMQIGISALATFLIGTLLDGRLMPLALMMAVTLGIAVLAALAVRRYP